MSHATTNPHPMPSLTIGLDLGDKVSRLCLLEPHRVTGEEAMMPTTLAGLTHKFPVVVAGPLPCVLHRS
ncbi:MAG: hypothetical protein ACT4P6_24085 [Gemmatimonadaceae bacterium]